MMKMMSMFMRMLIVEVVVVVEGFQHFQFWMQWYKKWKHCWKWWATTDGINVEKKIMSENYNPTWPPLLLTGWKGQDLKRLAWSYPELVGVFEYISTNTNRNKKYKYAQMTAFEAPDFPYSISYPFKWSLSFILWPLYVCMDHLYFPIHAT